MERIFIESEYSLEKMEYLEDSHNLRTYLYLAHKPQSDYFIYLHLPERLLPHVTNEIQIKLASLIKNRWNSFEKLSEDNVKISSSFEKNATLIIFTKQNQIVNLYDDTSRQVISIEEDPYFFKKQVLVIPSNDIKGISNSFDDNEKSYITYLQDRISDTKNFNDFMNSKTVDALPGATEYSFVAKLYEKLPFLTLSVKASTQRDLQTSIDNELSEAQLKLCETYFASDLNHLDDWIAEILERENDA